MKLVYKINFFNKQLFHRLVPWYICSKFGKKGLMEQIFFRTIKSDPTCALDNNISYHFTILFHKLKKDTVEIPDNQS